ncbi:DUF805 domain-containing protein [Rufibacter roseus]|uniref:DUF805 domain-containing protein n=1 Tax=Rufibacter roseus TaxID=1567108 RepID=A0ABW2DLP6_9BACT|nr:DUF805 domain-containing protein [Rufibacter roseus]
MFRNPFSFSGRIRRLEYGLSYLVFFLFGVLLTYLTESGGSVIVLGFHPLTNLQNYLSSATDSLEIVLVLALNVPFLWFILAQGAKRSHDMGTSGWLQLIPFFMLVLLFWEGDHKKNKFGQPPGFDEKVLEDLNDEFWQKEPVQK